MELPLSFINISHVQIDIPMKILKSLNLFLQRLCLGYITFCNFPFRCLCKDIGSSSSSCMMVFVNVRERQ